MRHYELTVVLSPMLDQEQAADTWGRIKEFISNRNGEITHEEKWGTRRLAYAIRKGAHNFLEGSYHITRFSTEQPFVRELETFLRVNEQVLRSLVVATAPPKPAPAAVAPEAVAEAVPAPLEAPVAAVAEPVAEEAAISPRRRRPTRREPSEAAPEPAAAPGAEAVAAPPPVPEEPVAEEAATAPRRRRPARQEPSEAAPEPAAAPVSAPPQAAAADTPKPEQSQS